MSPSLLNEPPSSTHTCLLTTCLSIPAPVPGPLRRVLRSVRVDTWAGQLRCEPWQKRYLFSVEDPFDT